MKKLLAAVLLAVSSVAILLVVYSLRGTGDPFFVNIGTHRFLLTFDDTSLTKSQRTAIVADLQHEYTSLTNLPVILHDSAGEGYVEFTAYGITPYENYVRLPFTYDIDNGVRVLHVEVPLSERYKVAFSLQRANRDAFQAVVPFVESLKNGLLHSMASTEVCQIFYYEKATPEMYAGSRDDLATFLDHCTPMEPGLLSFRLSDEYVHGHGQILVVAIPYIDHEHKEEHHATAAVWMDNRWKLLLWD